MIILKSLGLRRSATVLLDNTSVSINPGKKVGLAGRNGAGKSSIGQRRFQRSESGIRHAARASGRTTLLRDDVIG